MPAPRSASSSASASSATPAPTGQQEDAPTLDLRIGHEELVIRGRYEILSIANDILIGLIFLIGSFLFFSSSTVFLGTVLFVIGSVLMLIRPTIRLARRIHLQRLNPALPTATSTDF